MMPAGAAAWPLCWAAFEPLLWSWPTTSTGRRPGARQRARAPRGVPGLHLHCARPSGSKGGAPGVPPARRLLRAQASPRRSAAAPRVGEESTPLCLKFPRATFCELPSPGVGRGDWEYAQGGK
ncbi:hypothetical protein MTO96_013892 [Rhipicephalus appendiculatus]